MKIALASDLHHEFYKDNIPVLEPVDAEILILAGDIETVKSHNDTWWQIMSAQYKQILYIRGNHEDYGSYHVDRPALEFPDNVIAVGRHPQLVKLGYKLCLAGTMWTNLSNPTDESIAKNGMNDYRHIKYSRDRYWFTPQDTTNNWNTFRHTLDDFKPEIVVSHHLPSYGSISPRYKNDRLNASYATEMDVSGVSLWMHGHTHTACDYVKDGCRIVCNPRGYPGENPGPYKPKVIEI